MQSHTFQLPTETDKNFTFITFEKYLEDGNKIAGELWDNYRSTIIGSEALVLRPPVDIPLSLSVEELRKKYARVIERFEKLPVYILYSNDFEHKISGNIGSFSAQADALFNEEIIPVIQKGEMEDFVLKSNAIFRSPPNSIFRTPSFDYTYNFLRVGNIQVSRDVLDGIFFWTLPYLKDKGALLTDSWSISSIALNISRLLYRYFRGTGVLTGESDGASKWARDFHVNFLSTYYNGRRSMSRETDQALQPLLYNSDRKILFLISAVKTENSLKAIKKEISEQGYDTKVEYLSLYELLEDGNPATLCFLPNKEFLNKANLDAEAFRGYPKKPGDETVIVIDEKTFFPVKARSRQIKIKKKDFKEHKVFFETYCGHSVITLHRNAYFNNRAELQRHHGIFIDVGKMSVVPEFLNKLKIKVGNFPKAPKVLIYPPHEQGEELVSKIVEQIVSIYGDRPQVLCFAELNKLAPTKSEEYRQAILDCGKDDLVLVVDDVCSTGKRLKGYQKMLRELPFHGTIQYLVGVARLTSKEDLDALQRDLVYGNHKLDYVENLFVPLWEGKACPWCCEQQLIDELLANPNYKPFEKQLFLRQSQLTNGAESGLSGDCFYGFNGLPKPHFQQGSIAPVSTKATEAEVVACFACAIQYLRNSENVKDRLGTEYPLYKILRINDYLGDTFNEAMIKASIIRSASHTELYAVDDALLHQQKVKLLELIENSGLNPGEVSFFLYELFIALKEHKLPKPDMEEKLRSLLVRASGI